MNFIDIEQREIEFDKDLAKIQAISNNSENFKDDQVWIKKIIDWIYTFYNQIQNKTAYKSENENSITTAIRDYLKENKEFEKALITVNTQVQNDSKENLGFYDLKFQSNLWQDNKYLTLECKRMADDSEKIKEYVYNTSKEDGGMYRFVQDNKYSPHLSFGAMLGYIQKDKPEIIVNKIKEKIKTTSQINLINPEYLDNSTFLNYSNTFQSQHVRNNKTQIELLHLFFDFN